MQIKQIKVEDIRRQPPADQPDCGLGHACQFCPRDPDCNLDKPRHEKLLIESRLEHIDQIILVMANKGGVGKSTVSANLAASLAARGHRVGVADADIHGPNQSRFFGFVGHHVRLSKGGLDVCDFHEPLLKHPIKVGSLAFLMQRDDTPIVWRDAYKHDFMHHLIGSFNWGPLDYLIVDMPPGTGNELITLSDMLEGSDTAALLVTTPQEVALMDSLKAVRFCQERGMPLLGVVENMSGVTCPHCHGEFHLFPRSALAGKLADAGVESLARLPLDPVLAQGSDDGMPDVLARPNGPVAQALAPAVDACIRHAQEQTLQTAAHTLHGALATNLSDPDLEASLQDIPDDQRERVRQALQDLIDQEQHRIAGQSKEAK